MDTEKMFRQLYLLCRARERLHTLIDIAELAREHNLGSPKWLYDKLRDSHDEVFEMKTRYLQSLADMVIEDTRLRRSNDYL